MNPFFFGDGEALLYGVHHPPKTDARSGQSGQGIVLCSAFGQEYMRAHRAYRQLALLLSRKGFHVLRFDYRGTGDSSGDPEGVSANDWVTDVGLAIDELKEVASIPSVTALGLRLGALLAASACAARTDVDRLVLWDPVRSGASYEDELLAAIASEESSEYAASSGNGEGSGGELHYNGFSLSRELREGLRSLDVVDAASARVARILHAVSHETEIFSQIRDAMRVHPGYRYQFTSAPHDWNYVDNFGGILLPQPVIQAIVQWLEVP